MLDVLDVLWDGLIMEKRVNIWMFSREYECLSGEQKREGGRKGKGSKKMQGSCYWNVGMASHHRWE